MFGYLNIEKEKLQKDKQGVWQTFMCGMCFSTKRQFGNLPRMYISNDVNFFSVLFHAVTGADVNVEQRRCFSSPLKKRPVLEQSELIDKMSVANVLLTYWNLYDDVVDGGEDVVNDVVDTGEDVVDDVTGHDADVDATPKPDSGK